MQRHGQIIQHRTRPQPGVAAKPRGSNFKAIRHGSRYTGNSLSFPLLVSLFVLVNMYNASFPMALQSLQLPWQRIPYFVLICFNVVGSCRKLFAYALGTNRLSCGSATYHSYPCFSANAMASSLELNVILVPCITSPDDCQPISGFSHRCPLPSTSQSMRHAWLPQVPDCVLGRTGL